MAADGPGVLDPTVHTLDTIRREIATLRELLQTQILTIGEQLHNFQLNHEEKHRTVVETAIAHRKELSDLGTSALRAEVFKQLNESDRRYQERFEAQTEALNAAFSAQQNATSIALANAEKAVAVALASAEKAVTKAEVEGALRLGELEKQIDRRMRVEQEALAQSRVLSEKRFEMIMSQLPLVKESFERIDGLDRVTDAKFVTFRTLIDSQADKVALALAASDKAVTKAEVANEKRFENVNEFRNQLSDQTKTFVSRVEFSTSVGSLSDKLDDLKQTVSGFSASVDTRLASMGGKSAGLNAGWVYILGGLGAFGTIVSIIIAVFIKN